MITDRLNMREVTLAGLVAMATEASFQKKRVLVITHTPDAGWCAKLAGDKVVSGSTFREVLERLARLTGADVSVPSGRAAGAVL